jgi:hypothetical protein
VRHFRRALAVSALGLIAFATFALLARFAIHGPVSDGALAKAVERESESAGQTFDSDERCREVRNSIWRCSVTDQEGSGGATYRVQLRPNSSCWDATLAADDSEGGMPESLAGCVYLWQWSLAGSLL